MLANKATTLEDEKVSQAVRSQKKAIVIPEYVSTFESRLLLTVSTWHVPASSVASDVRLPKTALVAPTNKPTTSLISHCLIERVIDTKQEKQNKMVYRFLKLAGVSLLFAVVRSLTDPVVVVGGS